MVPSLKKTKFGRKVTEDMESMSSVDEVMDSEAILVGEIHISLNCFTIYLTLPAIFKLKKAEEDLVKVEGKHLATKKDEDHGGVIIESLEECRPQKVILEKPSRYINELPSISCSLPLHLPLPSPRKPLVKFFVLYHMPPLTRRNPRRNDTPHKSFHLYNSLP